MERAGIAIAILVGSSGCTALLGLDSPELAKDAGVALTDADAALDPDADPMPPGCTTLPLRAMDDDDNDTLNDTVDNCFGQSNPQPDDDNDGIGNACDPRMGADSRYCVWTFRAPGTTEDKDIWEMAWALAGTWKVENSRLAHAETPTVDLVWTRDQPFESAGGISFDMRYHLDGYTAPVVYGAALEIQGPGNMKTLYDCRTTQAPAANAVVYIMRDGVPLRTVNVPALLPSVFTAYVRFSAIRQGGKLIVRCTVDMPALPGISASVEEPDQPVRARIGVFADRANIAFDHFSLYKLGP